MKKVIVVISMSLLCYAASAQKAIPKRDSIRSISITAHTQEETYYLYWLLQVGMQFLDKSAIPVNQYSPAIDYGKLMSQVLVNQLEAWRKQDSVSESKKPKP